MSFRPEVLDFLRAEGLLVRTVNGWERRGGETFAPGGSVNHHTAVGGTGYAPSLSICTYGRSDLDGPLCNVLQSREVDRWTGLDIVYLIAAGRANHAGSGGWAGLAGNSRVWGLEIEHRGTTAEPFPVKRAETAVRIHTAFAKCSRFGADKVCQHLEWAPGRKVDFVGAYIHPRSFRESIHRRLTGLVPPAAPAPTPTVRLEDQMLFFPPWLPVGLGSRDPAYKLYPVDQVDGKFGFRLVSFNGAPFTPAWKDGQTGIDGVSGLEFRDELFFGFWSRVYRGTTGDVLGGGIKGDRLVIGAGLGGTYTVAKKAA